MSNFTDELDKLHQLSGAEYSRHVERIALRKEFHPLDTDSEILIFKGRKRIPIKRTLALKPEFFAFFKKAYER